MIHVGAVQLRHMEGVPMNAVQTVKGGVKTVVLLHVEENVLSMFEINLR